MERFYQLIFLLICVASFVDSLPVEVRTEFPILQPPDNENAIISEENDGNRPIVESGEDEENHPSPEEPLGPTNFPILTPSDPPMGNEESQEDLHSGESTIYPILTPSNPPVNDEEESDFGSDESTIYPILIPQQECKKLKQTCKAKGNKGRECEEFKEKCGSKKSRNSRKGVKNSDDYYDDCEYNGDCDDYYYLAAREASNEKPNDEATDDSYEQSQSEESDEQGPDIDGLSQCVNSVMNGGNSSACPSFIG